MRKNFKNVSENSKTSSIIEQWLTFQYINDWSGFRAGTSYGRGLNYENLAYTEDYETRTEEMKPKLSFSDITPGYESNDDYNFQMRHENQIEDTGL